MRAFRLYDLDSAPPSSRSAIEMATASLGTAPNLLRVMAGAPALTDAYLNLAALFEEQTDLTAIEQEVVLLTVARCHGCSYSMAARSLTAKLKGVPQKLIDALRNDRPLPVHRLEELRKLTQRIVENRAVLSELDINDFYALGYGSEKILDVLVGVACMTLMSYVSLLADLPLDESIEGYAWFPPRPSPLGH